VSKAATSVPFEDLTFPDIKFVNTEHGEYPTLQNSMPLQAGDEAGRGSLVYFNQASMHQSAETGYATLGDARQAGLSGNTNYGNDAQAAFEKYTTYLPVEN
jgi:hypothetical protein